MVTVVDRDAPLGRPIDRVADERELIAVGRRGLGSEIVMEVDGIAADLILAELDEASARVELGVVEHAHFRPAHVSHLDVSQIDVGARHENHVTTSAHRILGPDHDIAADIADVWKKFELAVGIAGPFVVVSERHGQRHLRR